ncbi:HD-GYP domain-containing protein [Marinospirillum perlucidum]|uniref:HD-GYP domain-containing protein n=1 Tax=Marinospirillum perlucidum TaxID=1982602 RepID=UPI000DF167AA|nr:HD-GYP domain-containing protein [Marinospirillum perlucidum]
MIKVIHVDQLRVGMFVSPENTDWVPAKNHTKSGVIRRQEVIEKIRARGIEFITIDTEQGEDVLQNESSDTSFGWQQSEDQPSSQQQPTPVTPSQLKTQQEQSGVAKPSDHFASVSLQDEQDRARRLHDEALQVIDNVMERVKSGSPIDVTEVEGVAEQLVDSVYRNQNALACLSRIRNKDAYLMEHSLNVGVLLSILAKSMDLDLAVVRKLAVAGLLHDIGKVQVADEVLHKPGKLEAEEWAEMKRHVDYGEIYLSGLAVDSTIQTVCGQHHERLDGTGYPRGLKGDAISIYGRMAAVCDVYDAITADRVYHKGMTPSVAMKRLVEWSDDHLDRKLVYRFIRAMSIYPVGTLVLLGSDKLAIVVETHPEAPAQPRVRSVYNARRQEFEPVEEVDLRAAAADHQIIKAVDPSKLRVKIPIMDFI